MQTDFSQFCIFMLRLRLVEQNEAVFLEAWNEHFDQH